MFFVDVPFREYQSLNIPSAQLEGATALIRSISEVTGNSEFNIAHDLQASFWSLGGTSLNLILVVKNLRDKKYQICALLTIFLSICEVLVLC